MFTIFRLLAICMSWAFMALVEKILNSSQLEALIEYRKYHELDDPIEFNPLLNFCLS